MKEPCVRAYNQMNLYSKKTVERFKVFVGFKNMVCCNLCVYTDGYLGNLEVSSTSDCSVQFWRCSTVTTLQSTFT